LKQARRNRTARRRESHGHVAFGDGSQAAPRELPHATDSLFGKIEPCLINNPVIGMIERQDQPPTHRQNRVLPA